VVVGVGVGVGVVVVVTVALIDSPWHHHHRCSGSYCIATRSIL
jgi:hypothetical protein